MRRLYSKRTLVGKQYQIKGEVRRVIRAIMSQRTWIKTITPTNMNREISFIDIFNWVKGAEREQKKNGITRLSQQSKRFSRKFITRVELRRWQRFRTIRNVWPVRKRPFALRSFPPCFHGTHKLCRSVFDTYPLPTMAYSFLKCFFTSAWDWCTEDISKRKFGFKKWNKKGSKYQWLYGSLSSLALRWTFSF